MNERVGVSDEVWAINALGDVLQCAKAQNQPIRLLVAIAQDRVGLLRVLRLARIRTQMSAALTREQLDRAIEAFKSVGKELGVIN